SYEYFNNFVSGGATRVTGIPTDGRTIYVTMWSLISGAWQANNYSYHAFSGGGVKAQITSPSNGSTFGSGTVTFNWSLGSGVSSYYLYVGNSFQSYEYFNNFVSGGATTVSGIPTDGRTIYVTMWSRLGDQWQAHNYSYHAFSRRSVPTRRSSDLNGSTFGSGTVTFNWSLGSGVSSYYLYVGNSFQSYEYFNNFVSGGATTVSGIPTDGRTIYVTMWS